MQVLADGAPLNNATLINGQGRYPGGVSHCATGCLIFTECVPQPDVALAVVSVQSGKRYRFRLISMACDPNYMFSIDGHNLTVIEVTLFFFMVHEISNSGIRLME